MLIELENKAADLVKARFLGATSLLISGVSNIKAQRDAEFNARMIVRRTDFPSETDLQSIQAVEASMNTAVFEISTGRSYDQVLKDSLNVEYTKLSAALAAIQALI